MNELERIKAAAQPREILFVADAMTGQEAVTVAGGFMTVSASQVSYLASWMATPKVAPPFRSRQ